MPTAKINESIHAFQQFFENVSDASLIIKDGVYIDCNPAALAITGFPDKSSILNAKPADIAPPLQPDGTPSSKKAEEMLRLALKKGKHNFEWDKLRFDGSSILLNVTLTPIELGGEQYVHALWCDRLEQSTKHQTESMNQFIEKMGDAHLVLKNGVYIECNQAAVDMLGYPNKQSLLQLKRPHFYPELQPDGRNSIEKAMEVIEKTRQKGSYAFEWTYKKRDGALLPTMLMMTFAIVDDEEVLHIVWRDMSSQIEAHSDSIKKLLSRIGDASLLIKDNMYVDCNQAAVDILSYPNKQALLNVHPIKISPVTQPDGRDSVEKANEIMAKGYETSSSYFEWEHLKYDGTPILVEVLLTPVKINNEGMIHVIWRDITAIKRQQYELQESEQKYKALFEDSGDAMLLIEGETFVDCNDATVDMLGYNCKEEILNTHPSELSPLIQSDGSDSFEKANEMIKAAFDNGSHRFEWDHLRKNGNTFPVEVLLTAISIDDRQLLHIVWRDITDKKIAESEIKKLAYEDTLTGLPNRRTLIERLSHVLDIYKRTHYKGALLFIDLDHFKNINDTLGHHEGDQLLQQVARRLVSTVRAGDTVARFGGDEFVVLLEDLEKESMQAASNAEIACEKILLTLNKPYPLKGKDHHISASIGVSMFTEESLLTELLQQSDIAMYQAKASGRNAVKFFDPKMQQAIDERAKTEQLIKDALSNNFFELHYQVQVNCHGKALGVEALLRLKHPDKGYIPPMHYIPVAEETGLILHVGNFVLETACKQLKKWESNSHTNKLSIAINVSPLEFKEHSFVMNVLASIQNHNINPSLLKLELTETMLVDNIDAIIDKMNILKENGVQFSMDDFGTGYSSLQYLRRLPIDQLKIDQSFVRDLEHDEQDCSIVKTIIVMGHALKLDVIAEGVENTQQQDMLLKFGCSNYQGYLFSKPLPIDEFEKLL